LPIRTGAVSGSGESRVLADRATESSFSRALVCLDEVNAARATVLVTVSINDLRFIPKSSPQGSAVC
jgi:hypothetical protein